MVLICSLFGLPMWPDTGLLLSRVDRFLRDFLDILKRMFQKFEWFLSGFKWLTIFMKSLFIFLI